VEGEEFHLGRAGVVEETTPDVDEELWTGEDGESHAGWFCVRTNPFPCPAAGCGFVAEFMTAAHLVLVWEERDDPNLLRHAQRAKEVGRNPRVVTYEPSYGPRRDRRALRRVVAAVDRRRGGADDSRRVDARAGRRVAPLRGCA
jgi:hypothetical protein